MPALTHSRNRFRILFTIVGLSLCSGCTSVRDDGTTATYGYAAWVPLSIALTGLGIVGWGYLSLFRDSDDDHASPAAKGIMTMLGGGFVVLFVAPAFAVASVKVGADKAVISGSMLWFVPSSTIIDYNRVSDIHTEVKERWTRRGRRKSETVVIAFSDGKSERMSKSVIVSAALPRIVGAIGTHQRGGNGGNFGDPQIPPGIPGMGNPEAMPPMGNPMHAAALPNGGIVNGTANTNNSSTNNSTPPPPGIPVAMDTALQAGLAICGQATDGKWYPSRITEVIPNGTVKIHYEGFPDAFDEVVPRTRIRISEKSDLPAVGTYSTPAATSPATNPIGAPNQPVLPVAAPTTGLPSEIVPPANTIEVTSSNLKPGQIARAFWGATWYNVKILEVLKNNQAKIHYEGYGDNFDEVVPFNRLRLPK